jgi:GT2 family glycosyltransferase
MENKTSIFIVIVNYKTAQLTINCLSSIFQDDTKEFILSVIVADNNSQDGSAQIIADEIERKNWSSWVSVLSLDTNGGFAYGNNRVFEKVINSFHPPKYLWLLNPDTVIHPGACKHLVEFLETHPTVGIVGSRLEDPDGTPQISAFRDHSVMSEFLSGMCLGILDRFFSQWLVAPSSISDFPHQCNWVSGASMMVRRDVFEMIGLMDEQYFMYYEEVDFCIHACKAGWECWYVPESRVVHLVGAASGITDRKGKENRRHKYWFESRHRFFLKNYGWLSLLFADLLWMIGYSCWRIRRVIQRKTDMSPPHFLRDFFSNSFFCKGFHLRKS